MCSTKSIKDGTCKNCGRDFHDFHVRLFRSSHAKQFNDLPKINEILPYRTPYEFRDSAWKKACGLKRKTA